MLPAEAVTETIDLYPEHCSCGCTDLESCDDEPLRFQTIDIPPIKPEVIEYVQHMKQCKQCGEVVYQPLSDDVKRNVFGSGVLAVVGVLTGMLNTSKRKALTMNFMIMFNPKIDPMPMKAVGHEAIESKAGYGHFAVGRQRFS